MNIEKAEVQDILELSLPQERMLYNIKLAPEIYYCQLLLGINSDMDVSISQEAWRHVVKKHDMLRAAIAETKSHKFVQIIRKEPEPFFWKYEDLTLQDNWLDIVEEIIQRDRKSVLCIDEFPFRVTCIKISQDHFKILISHNHIFHDGWSTSVILKDFVKAYYDISNKIHQDASSVQYKDFISHLHGCNNDYWEEYLDEYHDMSNTIPADNDALVSGHEDKSFVLHKQMVCRINEFCAKNEISTALFFHFIWYLLLQKYEDSDDIIFASATSGRSGEDNVEDVVGLFINILPLRFKGDTGKSISSLMDEFIIMYNTWRKHHNEFPNLNQIAPQNKEVKLDYLLAIENYPVELFADMDLHIEIEKVLESNHYNLSLSIQQAMDSFQFLISYQTDCYSSGFIEAMFKDLSRLIEILLQNNDLLVQNISIENYPDYDINSTQMSLYEKTIIHYFEENSKKYCDKPAVCIGEKQITYNELLNKVNGLCHLLKQAGVGQGTVVALLFERSIELSISLLSLLKLGAVYVPIDPKYPEERINYIINDSNASILLTNCNAEFSSGFITYMKISIQTIPDWDKKSLPIQCTLDDNAYIIYTSGSTGHPKGVINSHRSLINYINFLSNEYDINSEDIILQKSTYTFDISIWELLSAFAVGAKLVYLEPDMEKDPQAIADVIFNHKVTWLRFVPTALYTFLYYVSSKNIEDLLSSIRYTIVSGEALRRSQIESYMKVMHNHQGKLINLYGPTEAAIDVTHYICPEIPSKEIPIGNSIHNVEIYVLDRYKKWQPENIRGELYIGGIALANGYINQVALTSERFVEHPFKPGQKLYRTGDMAKWVRDQKGRPCFFCLGRRDNQVKLNGYRIELDEIERHLISHETVSEAAVVITKNTHDDNVLSAYYTSPEELSSGVLQTYLAERLPAYMVPRRLIRIPEMPLFSNGKIDRISLKTRISLTNTNRNAVLDKEKYTIEDKVKSIWQEQLQVENIDIDSRFFDVGGTSLNIIRVHQELQKEFGSSLTVTQLFQYTTIREISDFIFKEMTGEELKSKDVFNHQTALEDKSVAIIGISIRVPGAINKEIFWNNLINEVESRTELSEDDLLFSGEKEEVIRDNRYVNAGMFLDDIAYFDESFFKYNHKEAEIMDPQHRIFLQSVWEALEDAGYAKADEDDKVTGVYCGCSMNTYFIENLMKEDQYINNLGKMPILLGSDKDFLATRVCHCLDLKGPGITLQTACSTSLVAVHHAYRSILNGDCTMAVAGGVSIRLPQRTGYLYQEGGILSSDGHCRAFDEQASGTISGNGTGVVVLKKLSQAKQDNDHIYAVIRGSAINNDGNQKVGFTAPSISGQTSVIQKALKESGVDPSRVSYVEAHGTGTALGDPIEFMALEQAYQQHAKKKCALGSVKTNIGHLDAASGVAGLIKTALSLEKGVLPASLHFTQINSQIKYEDSFFYIQSKTEQWRGIYPRYAGVSSFGMGGTNVHMILEEYKKNKVKNRNRSDAETILFSAKTQSSLKKYLVEFKQFCQTHKNMEISDVAYTLATGRKEFSFRHGIVCKSMDELINKLEQKPVQDAFNPKEKQIVFLFPGQGSQYRNMGVKLYEQEKKYRDTLELCFGILKDEGIDLKKYLFSDTAEDITDTKLVQLMLFVTEYSVAVFLIDIGIKPDVMLGHSIGEYVAACIAGTLKLEDALKMVCHRGAYMKDTEPGAMLAASVSEQEAKTYVNGKIFLAAVNSEYQCVFSGSGPDIDELSNHLKETGTVVTRMKTPYAFHSRYMKTAAEKLDKYTQNIKTYPPSIPYISCLTGDWFSETNSSYWGKQLLGTVRYHTGIKQIAKKESVFIEIGPGNTLINLAKKNDVDQKHKYLATMSIDKSFDSEYENIKKALAVFWCEQGHVDWKKYYSERTVQNVVLPTYQFEKTFAWIGKYTALKTELEVKIDLENEEAETCEINSIQKVLCALWKELLGCQKVYLDDDFFDLSGNSMIAIQMISSLYDIYEVNLPLDTIFNYPTIQGLSEQLCTIKDLSELIRISEQYLKK